MCYHGDEKGRGASQTGRGDRLLTFFLCKVNNVPVCRLEKKETEVCLSFSWIHRDQVALLGSVSIIIPMATELYL